LRCSLSAISGGQRALNGLCAFGDHHWNMNRADPSHVVVERAIDRMDGRIPIDDDRSASQGRYVGMIDKYVAASGCVLGASWHPAPASRNQAAVTSPLTRRFYRLRAHDRGVTRAAAGSCLHEREARFGPLGDDLRHRHFPLVHALA
jgi:hypothetical protein